jgi:hypothetical protein
VSAEKKVNATAVERNKSQIIINRSSDGHAIIAREWDSILKAISVTDAAKF